MTRYPADCPVARVRGYRHPVVIAPSPVFSSAKETWIWPGLIEIDGGIDNATACDVDEPLTRAARDVLDTVQR